MLESQICQTAVAVLGAALSDLIPQGYLLKGGRKGSSFYYDIVMSETLSGVMLPHLENRMKEIISKDHPIKIHEMVPANAFEFFRHNRRFYPAHFVRQSKDPLVQVIQIDAFIDLIEGEFLEKTGAVGSVKLFKIEERLPLMYRGEEKRVYRIIGGSREEPLDPLKLGEDWGLFDVEMTRDKDYLEKIDLHWRGRGEALIFRIYEKWRRVHIKEGFELVTGGSQGEGSFAEFFKGEAGHYDSATTRCTAEAFPNALKKSMRIMDELSLIDGKWPQEIFEKCRNGGKELRFERKGSFLTVRKNKGSYTMKHSVFTSVEQMVIDILADSEKDLSQKKELLGIVTDCDE